MIFMAQRYQIQKLQRFLRLKQNSANPILIQKIKKIHRGLPILIKRHYLP